MTTPNNAPRLTSDHAAASRTKRIPHARVNEEEYATIMAHAARLRMSPCDYVRNMCVNGKITMKHASPALSAHELRVINGIGNNLNQLAKMAHTNGKRYDGERLDAALKQLDKVVLHLLEPAP